MNKILLIGGDSRSGGSLLARLFDFPDKYLSFPIEHEFFYNRIEKFYPLASILQKGDLDSLIKTEYVQKLIKFGEGKLTSKQFYDKKTVRLNSSHLKRKIINRLENLETNTDNESIYIAIAKIFFETLFGNQITSYELITNHCARTFIADLDEYFLTFNNGYFIQTIRSPYDYASSLKRYSYVAKGEINENINLRFFEMIVERWLIGIWYASKNKLQFGHRYSIISYEKLVDEPEKTLKKICSTLDIPFFPELTHPTLAGTDWGGNSSFGKLPAKITRSDNVNALKSFEFQYLEDRLRPFLKFLEIFEKNEVMPGEHSSLEKQIKTFFGRDFDKKISRQNFIQLHDEMVEIMLQ